MFNLILKTAFKTLFFVAIIVWIFFMIVNIQTLASINTPAFEPGSIPFAVAWWSAHLFVVLFLLTKLVVNKIKHAK